MSAKMELQGVTFNKKGGCFMNPCPDCGRERDMDLCRENPVIKHPADYCIANLRADLAAERAAHEQDILTANKNYDLYHTEKTKREQAESDLAAEQAAHDGTRRQLNSEVRLVAEHLRAREQAEQQLAAARAIALWSEATFGKQSVDGMIAHLVREVVELAEVWTWMARGKDGEESEHRILRSGKASANSEVRKGPKGRQGHKGREKPQGQLTMDH